LLQAEEDLRQARRNSRHAEDKLRDAGIEITLSPPRSAKSLKALRPLIDARIEERKSRK
jgi:hypothetical protein